MKVLISGAGISGLSLALRLRQQGLTPVIVERAPRLRDGGYMLGLADPGLDAAERMGVADALRAARHMPRRLVYVDEDGRERFALGGAALDRLVGERRFNLLRGDIERALYERVRGEVEVRFGASVESLEESARTALASASATARRSGAISWSAPTACTRGCARSASGRRRGSSARSAPAWPPSCSTARSSPTRSPAPRTR